MSEEKLLATHYIAEGNRLFKNHQFLQAIEIYKLAVEINPNFSWCYYYMGEALIRINENLEAVENYKKAIYFNQRSTLFHYSLAEALTRIEHWSEAIEHYQVAHQYEPDNQKIKTALEKALNSINSSDLEKKETLNSEKKQTNTIKNENWILTLDKYEKKVYSQSGEDGILERIFEKIGVTNKFLVEFGEPIGGKNSNSANLRINQGWTVLLFDVNPKHEQVFKANITAENINALFEKHKVPKSFDLLSIDIDGNDFWVWKALDENRFQPRVVMIEFNCNFPFYVSRTIAYNPEHKFDRTKYYGASLGALRKLGAFKNYSLIYHTGYLNAFFVLTELLPPNSRYQFLEDIFHPPDIESFAKKWGFGNPSWFNSPNPEQDSRELKWVEI